MKRRLTHTVIVAALSLLAVPVLANSYETMPLQVQDTIITEDTLTQIELINAGNLALDTLVEEGTICLLQDDVEYTEIDVAEIPAQVKAAVERDFSGYTVMKAAKGTDNTYRLQLMKDEEQLFVFYDENGVLLKQETADIDSIISVSQMV